MLNPGVFGRKQGKDKVHRLLVHRLEIQRAFDQHEQAADLLKPRQPRMGQGNTLAHTGVPLRAIEDSTVERLTTSNLGGRTIYLIGESGSRYYYAHLDEVFEFEPGDTLYAGEQIGTVGDTGNARGAPHLHLQWSPTGDSNWENPYPLLVALFGRTESVSAKAYGPPNARA